MNEAIARPDFYIVSSRKLILLSVLSAGLYMLAWFYQHWHAYRRVTGKPVWPVIRAAFAVFFAYSLFSKIRGGAQARGVAMGWSPLAMTVLFILVGIGPVYAAFFVSTTLCTAIAPIWVGIQTWILLCIQKTVNAAGGDPLGASNSGMTWVNGVWMTLGVSWMTIEFTVALALMPDTLQGWLTPTL